jgi:hypothetical protein
MKALNQDSYFQVDVLSMYLKNKDQKAWVGLIDNMKSKFSGIMSVYNCASLISLWVILSAS